MEEQCVALTSADVPHTAYQNGVVPGVVGGIALALEPRHGALEPRRTQRSGLPCSVVEPGIRRVRCEPSRQSRLVLGQDVDGERRGLQQRVVGRR